MEQIVPVYMLLVAGACIPDLTKLATKFVSAPVGSRVTTPGSCYDFNEHKFDEQNFDTHIPTQITLPKHKNNKKEENQIKN